MNFDDMDDAQLDEIDFIQLLIDWLSDKDADTRLYLSRLLNWDNAYNVHDWLVSQPDCDLALVIEIFDGCDPAYYLEAHLAELKGAFPGYRGEYFPLFEKLRTSTRDYRSTGLAIPVSSPHGLDGFSRVEALLREIRAFEPDFAYPEWALAPMSFREPVVAFENRTENSKYLRDLLYHGVATACASAEEIAAFKAKHPALARPASDPKNGELLPGFGAANWMKVLGGGFAVMMTIAVVMRRINYGVWF